MTGHPRDDLPGLLQGELPPATATAVDHHLAGCDACRRDLAAVAVAASALRDVARLPVAEVPDPPPLSPPGRPAAEKSGGGVTWAAGTLDPMSDVLRACGLEKTYRRGRAVDGVDLTVRRGERVALLGPNGAGKTTTLLMCLGVVEPDGGTVEVVGHRLPRGRSAAMAHVGFAAGYLPLPERLRVGEFLRMFGQLYGLADPEAQATRGMERFGIPHLAKAMGTELSSGQKTLVGIVKSTMHDPELLVLDEPTASLDPDVALRVRTGLAAMCQERGTALLVTSHNMVEVERIAERVVFLAAGRVVADGPPLEVAARFGRDDLEEVFLHLASERQASEHTEGLRP